MEYRLTAPMTREQARQLRCGDTVLFTGTIYTARGRRSQAAGGTSGQGEPLPFDVNGAVIYYAGPTPAQKGHAVGPAAPPPVTAWTPMPPKSLPPGPPA